MKIAANAAKAAAGEEGGDANQTSSIAPSRKLLAPARALVPASVGSKTFFLRLERSGESDKTTFQVLQPSVTFNYSATSVLKRVSVSFVRTVVKEQEDAPKVRCF
jgi:hypothetical protein